LYNEAYPNSFVGIQLNFPIFQGGKRIQQIRISQLQLTRIDWGMAALKDSIASQFAQALAVYKGMLNNYFTVKENLGLAKEVYEVIQLQYKQGIKTYLDVIIAESDLRASELNYTNALFEVLSSRIDVQRALGILPLN
jgi:outer membrane protein TolC